MNILFFLTPKSDVVYVEDSATLIQTLDAMEEHNYAAIPIVSRSGKYIGTIAEGDILRYIKRNHRLTLENAEDTLIKNIDKNKDNSTVNVNSKFENLIKKAINQNFVPVVDDDNKFIGIITRKDIMEQWHKVYTDEHKKSSE